MNQVAAAAQAVTPGDWTSSLRRKIAWLLLAKLIGLILLWTFFFSPAHRLEVTPQRAQRLLAIDSSVADSGAASPRRSQPTQREANGADP